MNATFKRILVAMAIAGITAALNEGVKHLSDLEIKVVDKSES